MRGDFEMDSTEEVKSLNNQEKQEETNHVAVTLKFFSKFIFITGLIAGAGYWLWGKASVEYENSKMAITNALTGSNFEATFHFWPVAVIWGATIFIGFILLGLSEVIRLLSINSNRK